jgi:RNA polymerase sigma-70 factor (ECF subfamily)
MNGTQVLPADDAAWASAPSERDDAIVLDPARDFGAVYETHYPVVYRAVRAIVLDPDTAEDITQDAFVKAYRARHRYRPDGRLEGWLCTIATREAISRLRWSRVQARLLELMGRRTEVAALPSPLGDHLGELLAVLPPKQRALVVLHFFHGYRYRELAVMLRLPEGTVASRLSQALARMRDMARQLR